MDIDLQQSSKKTPKFSLAGLTLPAKCVAVYDGDTAQFTLRPLGLPVYRFTCRMRGYNSAEIKGATDAEKQAAQVAKVALSERILDKIVTLHTGEFDKYGRLLVTVFVNGENINEWMVANSYGVAYSGRGEKRWEASVSK